LRWMYSISIQDGSHSNLKLQLTRMNLEGKQTSKSKAMREKVMTVWKKELPSLFFAPSVRTIPKLSHTRPPNPTCWTPLATARLAWNSLMLTQPSSINMAPLLKTENLAALEVAANLSLSRQAKSKIVALLSWNQLRCPRNWDMSKSSL
jgi:hypothetical protein